MDRADVGESWSPFADRTMIRGGGSFAPRAYRFNEKNSFVVRKRTFASMLGYIEPTMRAVEMRMNHSLTEKVHHDES